MRKRLGLSASVRGWLPLRIMLSASSLLLLITMSSCISIATGLLENASGTSGWQFGQFTDEWGDKTGKYFMQFEDTLEGTYSSSVTEKILLTVNDITFSLDNGLSFKMNEGGNESKLFHYVKNVSVVMKVNNEDRTFLAEMATDRKTFFISFSKDLVDILSLEKNITFRVTIDNTTNLHSYYQFDFRPKNFVKAFEKLQSYTTAK